MTLLLCPLCFRITGISKNDGMVTDLVTGEYDTGHYQHYKNHNLVDLLEYEGTIRKGFSKLHRL